MLRRQKTEDGSQKSEWMSGHGFVSRHFCIASMMIPKFDMVQGLKSEKNKVVPLVETLFVF